MLQILTVIAPLFLIIFASAIIQKIKPSSDKTSQVLNAFALNVGFPVLIFTALAKTQFSFIEQAPLLIANSLLALLSFALAAIIAKLFHLKKSTKLTLFICFVFGNFAYLGIPVLSQTYGPQIVPTASLIVAVYLFWIFTVGIGYLDYSLEKSAKNVSRNMLKNFSRNPLLISVILGLIVGSIGLTIPAPAMASLEMVSASVTPIVLIVIGLFIGTSKIGKIKEWIPVLLLSIYGLFIMPAMFYFGTKLFGYTPADFTSSIVEAAMPIAITPFALADRYSLDKGFIARSIVLSTIISLVSLPFWISIL